MNAIGNTGRTSTRPSISTGFGVMAPGATMIGTRYSHAMGTNAIGSPSEPRLDTIALPNGSGWTPRAGMLQPRSPARVAAARSAGRSSGIGRR